jgi:acetyl esterase/lipase
MPPRQARHRFGLFTLLLASITSIRAAAPAAPAGPPQAAPGATINMVTASSPGAPPIRVVTNVAYLPPERAEKLDLYLPEGRAAGVKSPALVWIHGGSWVGGDKGEARAKEICGTLAGAGYVAVSVNYKLGATWPQALLDCKNAVRFLRAHAAEYGVDPDRIAVGGGSAGGHLALMVGITADRKEYGLGQLEPDAPYPDVSSGVRAVLDLYGPANLLLPPVPADGADPFPGMRKVIADSRAVWDNAPILYGGPSVYDPATFAETNLRAALRNASPIFWADKGVPPVLIFHGLADPTVEAAQSVELDKVLTERGVEHEFVTLEGVGHSFDFEIAVPPDGKPKLPRDLRPVALAFLAKHLAPKPAQAPLTASMSDEQLLRALSLEPTALRAEKTQGKDGTTTIYSDAANEILITRSLVSGVVVLRTKPVDQAQTWKLGRP